MSGEVISYIAITYLVGWWVAVLTVKWCFKRGKFKSFLHTPWGNPDETAVWSVIFFWPIILLFLIVFPILLLLDNVLCKLTNFIVK